MDKPGNELSKEHQIIVDNLCCEFRNNLIRRFHEEDSVLHQQTPKNPEVLGANALIAEHLHNHGYFISQSVFSSEIELPANKLSSLQQPAYRLKESDIEEVLGALNLSLDQQEMTLLIERYNKNQDTSLLSTLLNWKKTPPPPEPKETTQKDLIAFNKYLKVLVSRIAKVSLILTELKRKRQELNLKTHKKHKKSPAKSRSRHQDSQIQDLAKKIERLTSRLAAMQSGNEVLFTGGRVSAKSYSDWVRELKNSHHGQRMIRKIEKIIVNSLNKEQRAMQKNYDEKLDTQKMILKLHYKQKFLEHFQALNLSNEPLMKLVPPLQPKKNENGGGACSSSSPPPPASKKVKKRNYKQSSKKCSMKKSANAVEEESKAKNKVLSKEVIVGGGADEEDKENVATRVESSSLVEKNEETDQDRKIRLKNVERLINDAKDRIKLLQLENHRLDQSFNTYLEQQSSQTIHLQKDAVAIWESYNVDRLLLEQRKRIRPEVPPTTSMDQLLTKLVVVPQIRVEKCKSNLEVGNDEQEIPATTVKDTTKTVPQKDSADSGGGCVLSVTGEGSAAAAKDNSSGEFSNPFINFDIKQFLESTTRPLVDETKPE